MRAALEGVRRTADAQADLVRGVQQSAGLGADDGERLFAMHMFAGGERGQADGHVGLGGGEIQHDVDFRIGQQRIHAGGLQSEFRRTSLGTREVGIGKQLDAELREEWGGAQVGRADITAPDQANDVGLHDVLSDQPIEAFRGVS